MPLTYHVSPDQRLLETRVTGAVTVGEIVAYRRAVEAAPGYEGDFDALIDVRDVTGYLGTDDLRQLGSLVRGLDPSLNSRRAIVTGTQDLLYGLIRQFESYAEGGPRRYRACRTVADALAWLGRPDAALKRVSADEPPQATRRADLSSDRPLGAGE